MAVWAMNQNICCTCRYWSGSRKIDYVGVFVESKESYSLCNGPKGSPVYVEMNESNTCSYWEKIK